MRSVLLCLVALIGATVAKVEFAAEREKACSDHSGCGVGKYCSLYCKAKQGCQTASNLAVDYGTSGLYCDDCSSCTDAFSFSGSCAHCNTIEVCSCTTCLDNKGSSCIRVTPGVCTAIQKGCSVIDIRELEVATSTTEYIIAKWTGHNQYHTAEIATYTNSDCTTKQTATPSVCQGSKTSACDNPDRHGDLATVCPAISKYPQFEVTQYAGDCSNKQYTLTTTPDAQCRKTHRYNHATRSVEPVYMKATCGQTATYTVGRTLEECESGATLSISFGNKEKCVALEGGATFHRLTAGSCFEQLADETTPTMTKICAGTSFNTLNRATGQDADVSRTLMCPSGTLHIKKATYKSSGCAGKNRLCHTTVTQNSFCVECVVNVDVTSDIRVSCQSKEACVVDVPEVRKLIAASSFGTCINEAEYLEIEYGCSTCGSFASLEIQSFAPFDCTTCMYTPYSGQCVNSCRCISHSAEACQCKSYEYTAPTAADWAAKKLDVNPEYLATVCRHPETFSCRATESDGTCLGGYKTCHQCGCTDSSEVNSFAVISCMSQSGTCSAPTPSSSTTCPASSPTCSKVPTPPLGSNCGCRRFIHPLTSVMGNSLLCISKTGDCYLPINKQCAAGLSLCHQCGCGELEAPNALTRGARYCINKSTRQCTLTNETCQAVTEEVCQTVALSEDSQVAPQQACGCSNSALTGTVCVQTSLSDVLTCTLPTKVGNYLTCPTNGYLCAATSTNQLERLSFTSQVSSVIDKSVYDTLVLEMAKYSVTVKLDISCPATAFACEPGTRCSHARSDMVTKGCIDYRDTNGVASGRGITVQQAETTKIIDFYMTSVTGDSVQNIRNARSAIASHLSLYGASTYQVLQPGGVVIRTITPAPTELAFHSGGSSSSCGGLCIGIIVFIILFALVIGVVLYCGCVKKKSVCPWWSNGDESNEKTEEGMMPVAGNLGGGGVIANGPRYPQRVNPVERLHEMSAHNTRNAGNTPAVVDVPPNGWQIGAACEAEFHGAWHPATITDYDGNLYEVKWTEDDTLSKVLPTELRPRTSIINATSPTGSPTAVPRAAGGSDVAVAVAVPVADAGVAVPIPSATSESAVGAVAVCEPIPSIASVSSKAEKKKQKKAKADDFAGPVASAAIVSASEHIPSEVEESVIASPEGVAVAVPVAEAIAPPPQDDDGW